MPAKPKPAVEEADPDHPQFGHGYQAGLAAAKTQAPDPTAAVVGAAALPAAPPVGAPNTLPRVPGTPPLSAPPTVPTIPPPANVNPAPPPISATTNPLSTLPRAPQATAPVGGTTAVPAPARRPFISAANDDMTDQNNVAGLPRTRNQKAFTMDNPQDFFRR